MKVQLGDREIWIEFAYETVARFSGQADCTGCLLRDASAQRGPDEAAPILAVGKVVRYFQDPPNRELARKAALAKALEMLDQVMPLSEQSTELVRGTMKGRRRRFWQAYLNRTPAARAALSDHERARLLYGSALYYGELTEEQWISTLAAHFAYVRADAQREAAMQSRVLSARSNPAS